MIPPADYNSVRNNSGIRGVCMMSTKWRDEQHSSFINFISSFLNANSFRLTNVPIAPDFIFNCGGVSVAFIFMINYDCNNPRPVFTRAEKLKSQFGHLYVVVILPTKEHNDSFIHSYFRYGVDIGKSTFVSALDLEMGFEKIVRIAHARGAFKREDVVSKLNAERERLAQSMDAFLRVVSSIPHVETHDANALVQTVGSIEAIAKASKENMLEHTDISSEKADMITRFFRDPKFYLGPKIT
ncbi:protein PARTING DANCERS homolog isoform X2 [Bidens hawaiensis]|uniref:protein PARTING DANCERS homolog isoform X2 n=1 Tax=Bidens hawaiensis TaxID=980011 RepID=UPI00404A93F5